MRSIANLMPSVPAAVLIVVGLILVALGAVALTTTCADFALVWFGLAILAFGGSAATVGGFTVLASLGVIALVLIILGVLLNHGSCTALPI
jgi:hypothetical protein